MTLYDALIWGVMLLGSFFVLSSAFGNFRFKNFFERLHPAGANDSMGLGLIILGCALIYDQPMIMLKLVLLFFFLMLTGAVANHTLAKTAYDNGIADEKIKPKRRGRPPKKKGKVAKA
jgi:multicomponent Na+:H+ antiporter subunit G